MKVICKIDVVDAVSENYPNSCSVSLFTIAAAVVFAKISVIVEQICQRKAGKGQNAEQG
jgi:hypothetical protein